MPIDSLSESTKNTLEDLGIANIECFGHPNANCHKNYSLSFNVVNKWHVFRLKTVQLWYSPCDKRTAKNYHFYDTYHQDIWGLGDDWYIYSDTDMF